MNITVVSMMFILVPAVTKYKSLCRLLTVLRAPSGCSQVGTTGQQTPYRCCLQPHHHHHYVPSVVNRSAVMDLHRSRSCTTLIQSLYDIFVHSLMLSVHIVLSLPRPLLPFILPSIRNRCTPSLLIICPKY